ncbi:hypothetical protein [Flavilitoribacter nigricans]|uniref:Peptidase S74 domain-containing protein n=1 Tax=Flavilitoribacter nigricans (strain ATCC 23147 / DSM 23189 / NBRC 102662 / NCIMB 1420 / SS-2) TaxID=1122177 RepID=A0A2D0NFS4_FLAN2|nr:hypothetical protein [Flavilitoribacter nigricans]PHN07335.1 hypothetical protein CRP01_06810 [Flavilitoribacter nigricans DSM 23189 = NBRC 102662]
MKLRSQFTAILTTFILLFNLPLMAQVTIGPDYIGINAAGPLSPLSINGNGDTRWGALIKTTSGADGAIGLKAETAAPACGSCRVSALDGRVESGLGYTIGARGISTNTTPSGSGRSYGVWAQAGNATSNYNYGLYGVLSGDNGGTAVLGWDQVNYPSWDENTNGTWAGYFKGDVDVDGRLAIGVDQFNFVIPNPTDPLNDPFDLSNYKLFVCGGILADEWLVPNATWCDYVFEENYRLTSLEEVEEHIAEKGHLHNTPSAKEIESSGLKVGDITVNQQEKIEEIFLHLIDMNKRLNTLEKDNADLKAENARLKAQLAGQRTGSK